MRILQSVALSITLSSLAASVLADTTLITNVNGYTLDVNRTLQQFSAIQFTDDLVDAIYNTVDEYASGRAIVITDDLPTDRVDRAICNTG